jgi:hypothetical protein
MILHFRQETKYLIEADKEKVYDSWSDLLSVCDKFGIGFSEALPESTNSPMNELSVYLYPEYTTVSETIHWNAQDHVNWRGYFERYVKPHLRDTLEKSGFYLKP